MNDIFGVQMTSIMVVLLGLLSLCLLSVAWVAWRRPVIFKLGVRNIPRRKAQSVLIVVGLMLSTLIIAAALGTGDTVDYSITNETYKVLGHVDEQVVYSKDVDPDQLQLTSDTIPDSALGVVEGALDGDSNVDGIMPFLRTDVPAVNETAQLSEPNIALVGIDPARLDQFGGLKETGGQSIDMAQLPADGIVLSAMAAEDLGAKVGDAITVYYNNQPTNFTVAAIAADSFLSGYGRDSDGEEQAGMALPLPRLQELTGQAGRLTAVLVSNTGGVRDSIDPSDAVVAKLEPALMGKDLGVEDVKQQSVDDAKTFAAIFASIFLVLGLFSIAAGILLIVLIFTMLAAERRSEMGMARAVGTQRRQLIQQFIAEGSGYAILAGMVGAGLGVLAALGIGWSMGALFGEFVDIEPYVSPRSMVVAYCLGVVITFLAVVGSSWKISRLNVVAAIRDLPDATEMRRRLRTLVWAGVLLLGGALMTLSGRSSDSLALFTLGMSMIPFGLALILRFFGAPSRPVFTVVGLYLLVFWLLPQDTFDEIFGAYDGDVEMFFLSGIFMVIAATIVILQNTDVLLAGVSKLGGLFKSKLPAVRTAVAYPGAAVGRTGMTIAMFSLIVFSLVMIATMNQNYTALFLGDDANAGWDVRADGQTANPIADFTGTLETDGVDTSDFTAVGQTTRPSDFASDIRQAGTQEWQQFGVSGMDDGFISGSTFLFDKRAVGYETDEAIIQALLNEPNVAIVDASATTSDDFDDGGDFELMLTFGGSDDVIEPVMVDLADPSGGTHQVKVIGVLDQKVSSLYGLYANQTTIDAIYPSLVETSYYVALGDAGKSEATAQSIESALLQNGIQATSIEDEMKDEQSQSTGFLYLIQGFMGLGLFVGVAAIGVIAFRSVVERRQQIGVLRAIGYQQGMVSLSFMIETAFIVGMGVISGTSLGLVLARNLFRSDDSVGDVPFLIPWGVISVILSATIVVALLMTWIPARQAARIAPAEALRYE